MLKYMTAVAFVLVFGSLAFGAKGGGKGPPGGGGGGGEEPPADPTIAYIDRTGGGSALVVMNADGSNKRVLVEVDAHDPNWSPDGQQIVFEGGNSGPTNALYVINVDGSGLLQLPKVPGGYVVQPAWSPQPAPDGQFKIAFMSFGDIWLVNPDGSGQQQLTQTDLVAQNHPTWDPSGQRLAVWYAEREPEPGPNGYIRIAEGVMLLSLEAGTSDPVGLASTLRLVSQVPVTNTSAFDQLDWARTQDKILYRTSDHTRSVADGNASDIWVLDFVDPANLTLTNVSDNDDATTGDPRWSPDDTQILFTRLTGRKKDSGVHVMSKDGTGRTSLGAKSGSKPDWRR